jgi:hypothetical protein
MFNNIHEQPLTSSQQPNVAYAEDKSCKYLDLSVQTDTTNRMCDYGREVCKAL